ncbi:hypothetical protein H5410_023663 [Solanum commersonii]|uniref:Tubby-like F-box protein n=1 Tax=Solanum commersonii TaxID=4109 RepID=A0A9J5ZK50_SOLCO|nr:hypothetical protein H5410_023663 [Solanum commersonii]
MDDGVTQYNTSVAYEGMTLNRKIWRSSIRIGRDRGKVCVYSSLPRPTLWDYSGKGLVDVINRDVIQEHCPRAEGNEKWDREYIKEKRTPDVVPFDPNQQGQWANIPPELLLDIVHRVEESETSFPARTAVVYCASVCKSWREVTKEIVKTPEECGRLTFPISLKQVPVNPQFIALSKGTELIQFFASTLSQSNITSSYIYWTTPELQNFVLLLSIVVLKGSLGVTGKVFPCDQEVTSSSCRNSLLQKRRVRLRIIDPCAEDVSDKLLLAAKRIRRATSTDFVISLVSDDFSRASSTYVGKLRQFTIYDSQPPSDVAIQHRGRLSRRFSAKQVSPTVSACNYSIATVSYELNVLRTRGPRRMHCAMHSIPFSSIQEGGSAPTPTSFPQSFDERPSKAKEPAVNISSSVSAPSREPLVLKNKAPRWHEQLQCWCLNFKGRVTVASVKNFQLAAAVDPSHYIPAAVQETTILQFGKIGKDIFTMDYCYPLSAFQAFAICLSSFDTKPACE